MHHDCDISVEDHGPIVSPVVNNVGVDIKLKNMTKYVKISSLVGLPIVKNHYLSVFELCDLDL